LEAANFDIGVRGVSHGSLNEYQRYKKGAELNVRFAFLENIEEDDRFAFRV
jgi:hypothetical protein